MPRSHFLLSLILSRLVFLFLEVAALVGFGWWMFHVGVRGSFSAVAFITVLGALSFAGLGMLVASRARTIEAVSGLMNLVMLPMWILSGTFFSYARFPEAMQPFVQARPLTARDDALRAVMVEGSRLSELGAPLGIVTAWGVVSFTNGCIASGKRAYEKKVPDRIHIGSITRFISPETASMVRARLATSMPSPANARAPSTVMNATALNEPRTPTWNIHQPKPTSAATSRNRNTSRDKMNERR